MNSSAFLSVKNTSSEAKELKIQSLGGEVISIGETTQHLRPASTTKLVFRTLAPGKSRWRLTWKGEAEGEGFGEVIFDVQSKFEPVLKHADGSVCSEQMDGTRHQDLERFGFRIQFARLRYLGGETSEFIALHIGAQEALRVALRVPAQKPNHGDVLYVYRWTKDQESPRISACWMRDAASAPEWWDAAGTIANNQALVLEQKWRRPLCAGDRVQCCFVVPLLSPIRHRSEFQTEGENVELDFTFDPSRPYCVAFLSFDASQKPVVLKVPGIGTSLRCLTFPSLRTSINDNGWTIENLRDSREIKLIDAEVTNNSEEPVVVRLRVPRDNFEQNVGRVTAFTRRRLTATLPIPTSTELRNYRLDRICVLVYSSASDLGSSTDRQPIEKHWVRG
jgi:hypothetical protein